MFFTSAEKMTKEKQNQLNCSDSQSSRNPIKVFFAETQLKNFGPTDVDDVNDDDDDDDNYDDDAEKKKDRHQRVSN